MKKVEKVKILKELPKSKYTPKVVPTKKPKAKQPEKFKDSYLNFYDDIKVPTRRYDW